ncbi:MAG: GntR family transcriptional regulator [Hyphomicrobiales bacterium]|nr:GntR family transcriptional regulator [Hyphomicrobiales bacterium]
MMNDQADYPASRGQDSRQPLRSMTIDPDLQTPLYHQIFAQLRDAIIRGSFRNDAFLPSEQEISARFGVSRITAKRALDELAAAGLAVRQQGRGTRVRSSPGGLVVRGRISGLVQSLHANARHSVKLIDFGYVLASAEIAADLGLNKGDEVQRAIRVWTGPDGPFSHLTTFVPARLGRSWTRRDLLKQSMTSLLESKGMRAGRAQEKITATLADRTTASRLSVKHGAPLLMINRTVFDKKGTAIEHIVALYPPARYQYLIDLD